MACLQMLEACKNKSSLQGQRIQHITADQTKGKGMEDFLQNIHKGREAYSEKILKSSKEKTYTTLAKVSEA